jgi:hypothetical protein
MSADGSIMTLRVPNGWISERRFLIVEMVKRTRFRANFQPEIVTSEHPSFIRGISLGKPCKRGEGANGRRCLLDRRGGDSLLPGLQKVQGVQQRLSQMPGRLSAIGYFMEHPKSRFSGVFPEPLSA